ncbi:MAG TPA: CotY/CotZ family spore coat protein, partial [Bacilli bacterium]|nr:CotY/CotZ family spore coat protein [Bacilli bacterium]
YMCNNNDNKCVIEILEVILLLQQNADCGDACLDTCDRAFLGCGTTCISCNTRPVMLYSCSSGSTPLSFPISKSYDETTTSNVFRIEKLDGNCATFRVLTVNDDNTFSATNSFFTINLNCLCVLRCLNDTYVECI